MKRSTAVKVSAMKRGNYTPERGDIIWINFTPQTGREQRGKRPALVISPKIYNQKTSLCICFPIISKIKGYPFEVRLTDDLPIQGVVLSDQIKSLDFTKREASFVCKAPEEVLRVIEKNIMLLICDN